MGLLAALSRVPDVARDAEAERDQLRLFIDHAGERVLTLGEPADAIPSDGGSGARSLGEEGATGRAVALHTAGHVAVQGPPHPANPRLAREDIPFAWSWPAIWLDAPDRLPDPDAPLAPWGKVLSEGPDKSSAQAPMWGRSIEDAIGPGGLGLAGQGEGGGSQARAIGLGTIGLGRSLGAGGQVTDRGMTGDGHSTRAPRVRSAQDASSPRLPPEVIQRTIRQNIGRFRLCYEKGLRMQPNLQGRVTTRFVIARDGSVAVASNAGSDFVDAAVVACVTQAFRTLSFPPPREGTVTVDYPLALSPE